MDAAAVAWSPEWERAAQKEQENSSQEQVAQTSESGSGFLKDLAEIFGMRNLLADSENDLLANDKYLRHPELEANISKLTENGLLKNADTIAPVHNSDGSTTYALVQIGLSNREQSKQEEAYYYSRNISVTVPAKASHLAECSFSYDQRRPISEEDFNQHLNHDRKRLFELNQEEKTDAVVFHTHGIYTGDKLADSQALLLELTNGKTTVNIDWLAFPQLGAPGFSVKSLLNYMVDRFSARIAERHLAPLIDKTIGTVGAENSIMIGYSHGGMFNTRYLRHRADNELPKIRTSLFAHPDVQLRSPQLRFDQEPLGLLPASAERTIVIGGQSDKQLYLSSFTPLALGPRLGNDSVWTRGLLEKLQALPITEDDRKGPNEDQHHLNYAGIASLLNCGKTRSLKEMQADYVKASESSRRK